MGVHVPANIGHRGAVGIHFKDSAHHRGLCFIYDILLRFLVHLEAQCGPSAGNKAFFTVQVHASSDLYGKLSRVVFGHTFKDAFNQYAAWIVGNVLFRAENAHTVLLKALLVDSTIIPVSGEAVKLINKHPFKEMF